MTLRKLLCLYHEYLDINNPSRDEKIEDIIPGEEVD